MTITIKNNHNGEIYELTPARGAAKSAWEELYSYVRTIDRCDHKADDTASVNLLVAIFRDLEIGVNNA